MIILAFTACVINTAPERCMDYSISFLENAKWVTPIQCVHNAQPELAKWRINHPRYRIARFKCVPGDKQEHEI